MRELGKKPRRKLGLKFGKQIMSRDMERQDKARQADPRPDKVRRGEVDE